MRPGDGEESREQELACPHLWSFREDDNQEIERGRKVWKGKGHQEVFVPRSQGSQCLKGREMSPLSSAAAGEG